MPRKICFLVELANSHREKAILKKLAVYEVKHLETARRVLNKRRLLYRNFHQENITEETFLRLPEQCVLFNTEEDDHLQVTTILEIIKGILIAPDYYIQCSKLEGSYFPDE